ncbi:hypothetical protein SH2C18_11880 [Clostridium sediminicola]|uniref:flagellar basal body-associated FliL family protein n=1 Tax=Clostridium sediminicola TaxID=3114879 RepID=UPI0031F1FB1D
MEENKKYEEEYKKKKEKKSKIIIIVLVIVLLVGLGGTYFYLKSTGFKFPFTKEEVQTEKVIPLRQFVVNLKTSSSRNSYLKATIVLAYMESDNEEILATNEDRIRDKIIEILRTKSNEELKKDEGAIELKEQLKQSLNELLGEVIITNIYYNDFMIQ